MTEWNGDRRITIERGTVTRDDLNNEVTIWSTFIERWAQRMDASDGERLSASEVAASLMSRFVIRSSPSAKTVTPLDRLNYDGAIWDVLGAKETTEGRNAFIEITAVRRAEQA